jgi:sirohydrochlorin cobaltochelatase
MTTMILLGQGSSYDPEAAAAVHLHAARVQAAGGFDEVRAAFWEQPPHIRQVLAEAAGDDVVLVPLLMSDGYLARVVLPRALDLRRPFTRRGAQRIHYCAPIGTHPRLPWLVGRLAAEAGGGPDSALVVVGHGTRRDAGSASTTWKVVHALRRAGRFAAVAGAFLDEEPGLPAMLAELRAESVVLVPFFLAEGPHTRLDIPARLAEVGARVAVRVACTRPVGLRPEFAELVVDLALNALGRPHDAGARTRGGRAGGAGEAWARPGWSDEN